MLIGAKADVAYKNGVLYAEISGEIDHHTARGVREEIDKNLYLYRPELLVIDLEKVGFMDSSGLGLILGRVSTAENVGASVRLNNVPPRVMKILNMAGVFRIPRLTATLKKEKAE